MVNLTTRASPQLRDVEWVKANLGDALMSFFPGKRPGAATATPGMDVKIEGVEYTVEAPAADGTVKLAPKDSTLPGVDKEYSVVFDALNVEWKPRDDAEPPTVTVPAVVEVADANGDFPVDMGATDARTTAAIQSALAKLQVTGGSTMVPTNLQVAAFLTSATGVFDCTSGLVAAEIECPPTAQPSFARSGARPLDEGRATKLAGDGERQAGAADAPRTLVHGPIHHPYLYG